MKEFIKIKNVDGSGEMLLRVARIAAVEDRESGADIAYRSFDGRGVVVRTASTAAEVLEAIEEQNTYPAMMLEEHGAPTVRRQGGADGLLERLRGKGV